MSFGLAQKCPQTFFITWASAAPRNVLATGVDRSWDSSALLARRALGFHGCISAPQKCGPFMPHQRRSLSTVICCDSAGGQRWEETQPNSKVGEGAPSGRSEVFTVHAGVHLPPKRSCDFRQNNCNFPPVTSPERQPVLAKGIGNY